MGRGTHPEHLPVRHRTGFRRPDPRAVPRRPHGADGDQRTGDRLLGGRARENLPAYANGWYGGAKTAQDFAAKAREVVQRVYCGMKFDPFEQAWKDMDEAQMRSAHGIVAAVCEAVGDDVDMMIEVHGRLSVGCAIELGWRLAPYRPARYEEPVTPYSLDLLKEVKQALPFPMAAGERLYMLEDFARRAAMRACDVVQLDLAHCGGAVDGRENCGVVPAAGHAPGAALLDAAFAAHPFVKHAFPSLWDRRWVAEFTMAQRS